MKELRLPKRIFERRATSSQEYAEQMIENLEEGLKALKEKDEEGCGLTTFWILDHKDGRIARIPPPPRGTSEYWHLLSERRDKAWMNYLKRKYNIHEDE